MVRRTVAAIGEAPVPNVETRAVARAAEICGEHALATCLDVEPSQLSAWLRGEAVPPEEILSKIAIIVADHAGGFESIIARLVIEQLTSANRTERFGDRQPAP
jgi:transcriptional regulator with XRE-family HTH domain